MFTRTFFKLFPPPKFLDEPYAGIDISDEAVHCVQFAPGSGKLGKNGGLVISKYGMRVLPEGIVQGGFIKEKEKLTAIVAELAKELGLDRVRSSLPEEEMYIFKTQVPSRVDRKTMAQNIEFKLEENVPLAPGNAIFYFDPIPGTESPADGTISASVAVAPRKVVETYLEILNSAGLTVISFEMEARALSRAFVQKNKTEPETILIVHVLKQKIGMYVIYGSVACFTSTVSRGSDVIETIRVETQKIRDYWAERGNGRKEISRIVILGKDASLQDMPEKISPSSSVPVEMAQVWGNAFSSERYVSPISAEDSFDYAVAAGLALPIRSF